MAEASFIIDGKEYDIPGLETFNMGEAMILYDRSGLVLEDFAIDETDPLQVQELEQKGKNPGFITALMIVALVRSGIPRKRAEMMIDGSNLVEVLANMSVEIDEENPTEPQKNEPLTPLSSTSTDSNGSSSGSDSQTSSEEPEETPVAIGTSE